MLLLNFPLLSLASLQEDFSGEGYMVVHFVLQVTD